MHSGSRDTENRAGTQRIVIIGFVIVRSVILGNVTMRTVGSFPCQFSINGKLGCVVWSGENVKSLSVVHVSLTLTPLLLSRPDTLHP